MNVNPYRSGGDRAVFPGRHGTLVQSGSSRPVIHPEPLPAEGSIRLRSATRRLPSKEGQAGALRS